jgi:hypothetical protein
MTTNTPIATADPPVAAPSVQCQYPTVFAAFLAALPKGLGCPTGSEISETVTIQSFQNGDMLWIEPFSEKIFVLFPDNTWQAFLNGWTPGTPAIACPEADGVLGPQMGFGLIWCSEEAIRSRLGPATGPEAPNPSGPAQVFENGLIVRTADGAVYVLYEDGAWSRYTLP